MKKIVALLAVFCLAWQQITCQTITHAQVNRIKSADTNEAHELKARKMVDIGLSEKTRDLIAKELNKLLANEYVLYTKTLDYHWNVKDKHFGPLHALFKSQYEMLFKFTDRIAERSLALGFEATGSLKDFLQLTSLDESEKNPDEKKMIKNLLHDHEAIIKQLREITQLSGNLNDWGTNNLAAELLESHEKIAWMLRAHLQ